MASKSSAIVLFVATLLLLQVSFLVAQTPPVPGPPNNACQMRALRLVRGDGGPVTDAEIQQLSEEFSMLSPRTAIQCICGAIQSAGISDTASNDFLEAILEELELFDALELADTELGLTLPIGPTACNRA